ncbi:MAG: DUF4920 domain-containing protein [Sandaracinaceae bacterium]|jgi:hypothetical protein|nr:DUF4920 domain-containing protein [Sandaracinaceae bacterium]
MKSNVFAFLVLALAGCSSASPAAPAAQAASGEQHAAGEACEHEGAACEHGEGHACDHEHASGAPAANTLADGSTLYGHELNASLPVTPLATILAEPARFAGQTVRTEGEVSAVCQRMGCWMELRAESGTVRVPIAGHAFNLPRDITGKHAVIEGTVSVTELSEAQRAHLASEGAQALASAVSISATGVQLR